MMKFFAQSLLATLVCFPPCTAFPQDDAPADAISDLMAVFDADGDGAISPREFDGRPFAFRRADRDGDGQLSLREVRRFIERQGQPDRRPPSRRGGPLSLQQGDPAPDVKAYDEEGKEFHLTALRDRYTVIVFGCLT